MLFAFGAPLPSRSRSEAAGWPGRSGPPVCLPREGSQTQSLLFAAAGKRMLFQAEPRSEAAPMSGRDHALAGACDFVLHHHCRSSRIMERHRTPAGSEWGRKPYKPGDCCPRPCRDRFNAGGVSLFCCFASLLKYLPGLSVKCCQEAAALCLLELLQPIYFLLL